MPPTPTPQHRVVSCLGGDATRIERRDIPQVSAGEMLLRLRAVGLCGTDLFKLATGAVTPGLVLGHELVGTVVALGAAVDTFAVGDRVAVPHHVPCGQCAKCRRGNETLCEIFRENLLEPGGFADYVLVRSRAVREAARKVPSSMSDDTAVWMEPAACVMRGVWRANIGHEDALIVIQGAGSMGLLHLLVLRAEYPNARVVVVDPVTERRAFARQLGAVAATTPERAAEIVSQASTGLGADAVFDTVGGASLLEAALALTREGGVVVLFAHAGDGERAGFDINTLFKSERRIMGSYSGGPAEQARVFELMCDGALDPAPLVSHRLDLDAFDDGVRLARNRQALKVVYTSAEVSP